MNTYITVHLKNFMCFYDRQFTFVPGSNLLSGTIGTGKSTVITAIYFVLYGGKKFQDVANDYHKSERTEVSFHFYSPEKEYRIVRSRPSERLQLQLRNESGIIELTNDSAQNFINNIFGLEDNFLASSMISQKKSHFLIDSSNADKIGLLQQITFGDMSLHNQVDPYLIQIKSTITSFNDRLKQLQTALQIQYALRNDLFVKWPHMKQFGEITKEQLDKTIEELNAAREKYKEYLTLHPKITSRRMVDKRLKELPDVEDVDEIETRLTKVKIAKEKKELSLKLVNFYTPILECDISKIHSDTSLYSMYISVGKWNVSTNLQEFIEGVKKKHEEYLAYREAKQNVDKLVKENVERQQINTFRTEEYKNSIISNRESIERLEKFIREKELLESSISEIKLEKICESDSLTSNCCILLLSSFEKYILTLLEKYIDMYIREKRRLELESKLTNFDADVLTIPRSTIERDMYLYSQYTSVGYNPNSSLEEFIENIKQQKDRYEKFLNQDKHNREIIKSNNERKEMNRKIDETYSRQIKEYEMKVNQLNEYNIRKEQLDKEFEKYNESYLIKFGETDDLSSYYLMSLLLVYESSLNELICPNCNHGLKLQNGNLERGNIHGGEEMRQQYKEKIQIGRVELEKRKQREIIFQRIEQFKCVPAPEVPETPIRQQYVELLELLNIQPVQPPIIDIIEIPSNSYNKTLRLNASLQMIHIHNEYITLTRETEYDQILHSTLVQLHKSINDNLQYRIRYHKLQSFSEMEFDIVDDKLVNSSPNLDCTNIANKYKEISILFNSEIDRRCKYEQLIVKSKQYDDSLRPQIISCKDKPELFDLHIIETVNEVPKPPIEIFTLPHFQYTEFVNLYNSLPLIDTYKKWKAIECDIEYDENEYKKLEERKQYVINVNTNRKQLQSMISQLPEDIPEFEKQIETITTSITTYEKMIECGKVIQEFNGLCEIIKNIETNYNMTLAWISKFDKLYKYIEETGRISLQEKLDEVNSSLKMILEELFDSKIEVNLTSQKTLKNGNTKFQITFEIEYKGISISRIERLSGGEENIVSIALLLAFSRMNSNPLVMMDEVMASLDGDMRDKCMKIINLWTPDKFVINICHEITKAHHHNIINM